VRGFAALVDFFIFSGWELPGLKPRPTQAVTELPVGAEIIFFRPLKRAGDVLTL
jgi:hypothetical protein